MEQQGKWIWLDPARHPENQKTSLTFNGKMENYAMAEFRRNYSFDREICSVRLRVSGDTSFRLYLNGAFVGIGPVNAGGDFGPDMAMPRHFANCHTLPVSGKALDFFAQVQLSPVVQCESSKGRGGFFLEGEVTFADGSAASLATGTDWQARLNRAYTPYGYDQRAEEGAWEPAAEAESVWNLSDAPIPMLDFTPVYPEGKPVFTLAPGEEKTVSVEFDRIYSGYVHLEVKTTGECGVTVRCRETDGADSFPETLRFTRDTAYRGFQMHSIGGLDLQIANRSGDTAAVAPSLIFSCYPVEQEGAFRCSDPGLTKVYDVCKWTLQICRQTFHLDSPRHQEPLACTGDYYIESLMTAAAFGDMRLARLDVLRTADRLVLMDGWMFHTTYSLIWVWMLHDVYRLTGDIGLVRECLPALHILLRRFHSYTDERGIVENPPNYMFVDWMVADGYSLHHPPKALGQTCLNAFYHGALETAVKLLALFPEEAEQAETYRRRGALLKKSFRELFWDEEKQLFFDGLGTPEEEKAPWRPANIHKRYYSRQSNTLAVLCGLCTPEEGKALMENILSREDLLDVQPYFMHFVLEAVWKTGLFEQFGLPLLQKWVPLAEACGKGLQEGWYKPEEGYSFDHSHAWGGTPAYQLPFRLLGLELVEPGFQKIRLNPRLYGLSWAEITVPTPFGLLKCRMEAGKEPEMDIPIGIQVVD